LENRTRSTTTSPLLPVKEGRYHKNIVKKKGKETVYSHDKISCILWEVTEQESLESKSLPN